MADDPAGPRDADGATTGTPADSTEAADTRLPDHDDEQSARRSDPDDEPGGSGEKHYEPL